MSGRAKIALALGLLTLALARPAFSFGLGHLSAGFGSLGAQGSSGPVAPPTPSFFFDSVAGSDSNNCTSQATPCQTPAKMASTATANSNVFLKAGSVFTTTYTVPQNGIKHNVYGTGAQPVFDASNGIASTWTQGPGAGNQESCTGTCVFASGMETASFTDWTSIDTTGIASITQSATAPCPAHGVDCMKMTANGTATDNRGGLTKTITALAINHTYYTRAYVYIPTGSMGSSGQLKFLNFGASWASLNWNGSAFTGMSIVMGNGGVFVNTYNTASFTLNAWHYVECDFTISATVGGVSCFIDGTNIGSTLNLNTSADAGTTSFELGNSNFGAILAANQSIYFDDLQINTAGPVGAFFAGLPTTTWSTPLATNPLMPVFPTGTQALNVANAAAISSPGQWFWDGSSTLYVYGTSNPGTTVGLPTRTSAITVAGKQNVSFSNLTVRGSSGLGGLVGSGNVSGLTLGTNFLAESNYQDGVNVLENTATIQNMNWQNFVSRYNGASGFTVNVSFQQNNYFAGFQTYGNSVVQNTATSQLAFSSGVHFFSQNANNNGPTAPIAGQGTVIENFWSYQNGPGSTQQVWGNGVHLDTVNGVIVRNANLYSNASGGLKVEKGGSVIAYDINAWNNAAITFTANYMFIASGGNSMADCQLFNVDSYGGYWGISSDPSQSLGATTYNRNLFTNNIVAAPTQPQKLFVSTPGGDNLGGEGTGNTYTFNNFGVAAASMIQYGSTAVSTYAAFDTAYGAATHSVAGDPLFVNPTASPPNFALQSGSPAIGASTAIPGFITAGTNLGSSWPASLGPAVNFRITNSGAFRITNTGANRTVSP